MFLITEKKYGTEIENDKLKKPQTRCDAKGLMKKLNNIKLVVVVSMWSEVFERSNVTSKKLQKIKIDLKTVLSLNNSSSILKN